MTLSKIDCDVFRGANTNLNSSSYSVLNPGMTPGCMSFCGAYAVKESLGSKLACTLSIERFNEAVTGFYTNKSIEKKEDEEPISQSILELAFKQTNSAVYNFGHKLAAGGKMSASVMGAVLDNNSIAVGKIGGWSAYLVRDKFLYPFFESKNESTDKPFLGSQLGVNVQTTFVPIEEDDIFLAFSKTFSQKEEQNLLDLVSELNTVVPSMARHITEFACNNSKEIAFSIYSKIGPASIYLD